LITTGIAQLARHYNIPSRGVAGVTESKCFDLQNGFERLQTLMLAAQAGVNYITCAGTYESTLVEALELLVIDDELAGIVRRMQEGIIVNDDTIAIDVIKKIATSTKKGVNFLGERHTAKYMKKELYIPRLINRDRRTTWRKKGSKDIVALASEKVKQVLENYQPPEISEALEKQLLEFIKKVEARTFEYYKEAEGISAKSVSLPGTEITFEEK